MVPFLFSISGGEIAVIVLIILIFFGSKSIPNVARTLGKTMRQFRDATSDIQKDITDSTKDIKKEFDVTKKRFTEDK